MKIVRDNPVTVAAAGTALAVVVIAGLGDVLTATLARLGFLTLPAALGLPAGPPGLRLRPLGHMSLTATLTESLAALAYVAVVTAWVAAAARRPDTAPPRVLGAALAGSVVAAIAAGAIRLVASSLANGVDLVAYLAYVAATTVVSAVIGLATGLLVATAAGTTAVLTRRTPDAPRADA